MLNARHGRVHVGAKPRAQVDISAAYLAKGDYKGKAAEVLDALSSVGVNFGIHGLLRRRAVVER